MFKMRKTWMLASALLLTTACNDDEDGLATTTPDGSTPNDASTADAGSIDSGSGNLDSGLQDAARADASLSDTGTADAGPIAIEIAGLWHADFGGEFEFSANKFGDDTIVELDRVNRTAITLTDAKAYFPNTYSKQVWTAIVNGSFYQCTQDFNKASVTEAKASTMKADPTSPATGGCGSGDFPWTQYSPVIELRGEWNNAAFKIDSDHFGSYDVVSYDNAGDKAVLSQGGGDAGAKTFGKVVWTVVSSGRAYYCIVAKDLASEDEAANSTATADIAKPTDGCNGGAWQSLTK